MRKIIVILFILILYSSTLFSQEDNEVDSITNLIPTLEGESKIDELNKVSTLLWRVNKNKSLKYAKVALEYSTEISYKKGIASALSNLGIISLYDNDNKKAILYLQKALNEYKKLNDTSSITKLYINLSAIYYNSSETEKSIEYAEIALDRLDKYNFTNDKELARSTLFNNLALCYINTKDYNKALSYINKTIVIKEKEENKKGLASAYGNLGLVYKNLDSLDLAIYYYKKSINLSEEYDDKYGTIISCLNYGNILIKINEFDSAKYYIQKSLDGALKLKIYSNVVEAYKEYSNLYEKKKEYKKALEYYKKSLSYKDSVNNKELYLEITKIEDKYEQEQEEKDLKIKEIEEQNNKILKHSLISIIIVILILIIVLYSRYKIKIRSERKLQELNQEKDKFFSILSHDLRGPFNAFLTLSDIMANSYRELKSEEVLDYAQKINKSAIRINNLLENLLEWAVSQTGTRKYTSEKINLYKLADKSIKLLFMNASKKNIEIINKINIEHNVFADLNSAKTILRNLINNSIKFTEDGGEIEINSKEVDNFYEISVNDTGVGISEENIKKIFRIDTQFSTQGTANEKGTGLGLILCKEFVEKNGGKIRVESELGTGTSFIFTLKKM